MVDGDVDATDEAPDQQVSFDFEDELDLDDLKRDYGFAHVGCVQDDIIEDMRGNDRYCLCLLYTSPSPRDLTASRMPSSA